MTLFGNTESSRVALKHLRTIKPNDGWALQIQSNTNDDDGVRLLRRNAPLTDHFFLDIHHHPPTHSIVGLLTKDATICQVLVDGITGRPVLHKPSDDQYVSCVQSYKGYKPVSMVSDRGSILDGLSDMFGQTTTSNSTRRTAAPATRNQRTVRQSQVAGGIDSNAPLVEWSEEDKQRYLSYGGMVLGAWIVLQVLGSLVNETLVLLLVLPGLYVYLLNTCPSDASFDAKKEVKRVLRGYHLPEDHPAKPRRGNFLEEWTAKISASVATEVGAAAGGYSVEITPLFVCKHATVTLPSLGITCEWIGCHQTWYHLRTHTPNTH